MLAMKFEVRARNENRVPVQVYEWKAAAALVGILIFIDRH